MKFLKCVVSLQFIVLYFNLIDAKVMLNTRSILVRPGSAFMQYMRCDEGEKIYNCEFKFSDTNGYRNATIDMSSMREVAGTPFGNRVSSLGRDTCGFKFTNFTKQDSTGFTLIANYTDAHNTKQSYVGKFHVITYDHATIRNTVNQVILGGSATVTCGITNVQVSCTMFDPKGNMVLRGKKKCIHNIDHVTMDHIGNWTCVPTLTQTMESMREFQELRVVQDSSVDTWYKEEQGFGMIGCRHNIYTKHIQPRYCQLVDPQMDMFTISQSVGATERYTTLGTDLENRICQIEFKLPLLPSEKGNWKCIIEDKSGGFIYVDPTLGRQSMDFLKHSYPKESEMYVKLGSPLTVFCQVPYSSSSCYIRSPMGESILGGNIDAFGLGECKIEIMKSNKSHIGTWACHYARPDEAIDDVIEIEVKEHYTMKSLYKDIDVDLYESVELMCRATTPIQSCQYLDPKGDSYSVNPNKKSNGISYAGRGFQYGDCGLRIKSVQAKHAGTWTCVINYMGNSQDSLKDTVQINIESLVADAVAAIATSVGISVGLIVLIVVVIAFVVYKRYRRQRRTVSVELPAL